MLVRAASSTTVLAPPAFHYRHSIQRLPLRAEPSSMDYYSQQEASLTYSSQPSQASSLPPRTPSPQFAASQPEPSIKPSSSSQYSQSSQFATSSQPIMSQPFHHKKMTTKERDFFNRPTAYEFKRHVAPSYPTDATPRPIVAHSQPVPLTRTDTVIIASPRPRSASPSLYPNPTCYRFPPVEPDGVFSQKGGEPKSKDYAYINPRIIRVKAAPVANQKTEPEINVDDSYNPFSPSQPRSSQPSTSSSQPRRTGGLARENAFASDVDWFRDERFPTLTPWPPPEVTQSQEYQQNCVDTPIVSPEGSRTFAYYNTPQPPTSQSYDLSEALMNASAEMEPQSMELGSAFEHQPHANLFSLSPLSSLASFSSMDTSSSRGSGIFEQEIIGDETPRHPRRVSAPCEAMQSLSLITPHSPVREGASQAPTTSPSHGYSLRSNLRTVSAASSPSQTLPDSPFSSPRHTTRQRAQSGGRSPPPMRRHSVNPQRNFDDPLSSSTQFTFASRPRKRSRSDTDIEGSQSQLESSGNDADVSNVEDGAFGRRATRTRSRKTRKLA